MSESTDYIEDESQEYLGNTWEGQPIPVTEISERAAPEYGSCMTWPVGQAGLTPPTQILTRRIRRHKAKLFVSSLGLGVTDLQVANPAPATANVLVYTVPAGQTVNLDSLTFIYTSDATVGNRAVTVNITDAAGNLVARSPAFSAIPASTVNTYSGWIGNSLTGAATGNSYGPLPNIPLQSGWQVRIVTTGTIGAADQISAITLSVNTTTGSTIVFNSKLDPLTNPTPTGFNISSTGPLPDWESQQPLYAIAIGGTAVVSVIDESYGER
jgi:hypothetical protein